MAVNAHDYEVLSLFVNGRVCSTPVFFLPERAEEPDPVLRTVHV